MQRQVLVDVTQRHRQRPQRLFGKAVDLRFYRSLTSWQCYELVVVQNGISFG